MGRLRHFFKRHPNLRWIALLGSVAAILGIILLINLVLSRRPETIALDELGFAWLEEGDPPRIFNYAAIEDAPAFSISDDGRWLAMRVALGDAIETRGDDWLFFDLEKKRFVASFRGRGDYSHTELIVQNGWTPDRLPVLVARQDRVLSNRRLTVGAADFDSGSTRQWLVESEPRFLDELSALPNRSHSAIWVRDEYNFATRIITQRLLYLPRWGKPRWSEMIVDEVIGWMEADRTLVAVRNDIVRLIDARAQQPLRSIPVKARLEESANSGKRAPGDVFNVHPVYRGDGLLPGDRLRFIAFRFRVPRGSGTPVPDSLDLWELNLKTEGLQHVMNLDWRAPYFSNARPDFREAMTLLAIDANLITDPREPKSPRFESLARDFVFSPDGTRVVAPISTATFVTCSAGTSLALAIASPGQAPRVLPIHPPRFYSVASDGSHSPSPLSFHMALLDENTLIYRGPRDSLWRYDLRTSAPVCLWRPPAKTGNEAIAEKANVAGRVVDIHGDPVPDRCVALALWKEVPDVPFGHFVRPGDTVEYKRGVYILTRSKTDSEGRFAFRGVSPGEYEILAEPGPGRGITRIGDTKGGSFVLEDGKPKRNLLVTVDAQK